MAFDERKYSENRNERRLSVELVKQIGPTEHFVVKNELGNEIGDFDIDFYTYEEDSPIGLLWGVELKPEYRDLGYGVMLYQKVAEIVNSKGYKFISGYPISNDAKRVWESLASKGFAQIDETKKDRQGHYFIEP